jgi:hypothetical protein
MIGDSLKDGRDFCRCDDEAQVTGRRLLKSEYLNGRAIDLQLQPVDHVIVSNDLFRQIRISFDKRLHRHMERFFHLAAHLQHSFAQGF